MLDMIIRWLENIIRNAEINEAVTKETIIESLKGIVEDLNKMKGVY